MKVATFNVNDVNRRLPNLLAWLDATRPDVACLQELKCATRDFPHGALERAGYGAVWQGEPRWNGVAILARGTAPVPTRRHLPGDDADRQGRYIEAAVRGVLVGCLYLPNGNPQPGPKFAYKLAWFERLIAHAAGLLAAGVPVVLAGDYNVVPTDADIYSPRSWTKNALLQPAPRAAFRRLLAQGWTDTLLHHAGHDAYTFWDTKRDSWARNAGMRIDHLLVAPGLVATAAGVDRAERGREGGSDHAPAWVRLKGQPKRMNRPSTDPVAKRQGCPPPSP